MDVAGIARGEGSSGLLRVNMPTLLAYLRGAQVPGTKTKMKKEELVKLVIDHIGTSSA